MKQAGGGEVAGDWQENVNVSDYSELVTMGGRRDGPSISCLVPHHICLVVSAHVRALVTAPVSSD